MADATNAGADAQSRQSRKPLPLAADAQPMLILAVFQNDVAVSYGGLSIGWGRCYQVCQHFQ